MDLIEKDTATFILSSFSAVIIVFTMVYFLYKFMLPSNRCSKIESAFPNGSQTLTTREKGPLSDYYIKTAYNCCSLGKYSNDYVGTCVLSTIIKQGVRCLDFEIYSIHDVPVVATSTNKSYNSKETYNSLPFDQVLALLEDQAFSGDVAPNPDDPLFLHLRIKSNNIKMLSSLNKMISAIPNVYNGAVLPSHKLSELMGKTIIIVNNANKLYVDQHLAYNMVSGDSNFNLYEYDNIRTMSTVELAELKKPNKLTMIVPASHSANPDNIDFAKILGMNCNMVAMRYQKNDQQLADYNSIFSDFAFIPMKGLELTKGPELTQTQKK